MSFDVTIIDDYKGQSVSVIGLKPIAKILSQFQPEFIIKNMNTIIEANLSEIVVNARGKARKLSGNMIAQTDYQMLGDMIGFAYSAAPYAFAQEKGFTTPTGGRVAANNFFIPAGFTGMRQYVADVQLFLATLLKGGTFAGRQIKAITRGAVTKKVASTASNVHRYVRKIALGGGKYRYVYPKDQKGKFTRVLKPGTGKGFKQVGRRRRVV